MDDILDLWNDGVLDALRGKPQASSNPHYLEGFAHGVEQRKVHPVMPIRPEGYYHMPVEG